MMQIFQSKLLHKIGILILALIIIILGSSIIDKNFRSKLSRLPGEVAGVIINNDPGKFLPTVSIVGATGTAPYQDVQGDVNISGHLDITGTSSTNPLTLNGTGTDSTRALNFNIDGANYGKITIPSGSGGAMAFWTGTANAATEKFRITHDGKVGIGTANPLSDLYIHNGTDNNLRVRKGSEFGAGYSGMAVQSANDADTAHKMLTLAGDPIVLAGGNMGIGTVNPTATLEVAGSARITSPAIFGGLDVNSWTSTTQPIVKIRSDASVTSARYMLEMWMDIDGSPNLKYKIRDDGASFGDAGFTTPADYAEYFYSDETDLRPGELICLDSEKKVKRCLEGESLIGVVSTKPGVVGILADDVTTNADDYEKNPHWVKIGLLGQVPIRVSNTNGQINPGDYLTSSPLSGVAMKANKSGFVVGKALKGTKPWNEQNCPVVESSDIINWPEDSGTNSNNPCFRLTDGTYVGKIIALVDPTWYDPDVNLTSTNSLQITSSYDLKNQNNALIKRVGAFGEMIVARLKVGIIETKKLLVSGVDILEKLNTLSQKVEAQQKEIEDLQKQVKELQAK